MKECDYCGNEGVEVACNGHVCCAECWEDGMKDWTPEKEENLKKLSKEVSAILRKVIPEIKVENGLAPDANVGVCTRCRKVIQSDDDGLWYCDCHDERKGIDPNDPSMMPIPDRFFKGKP